MEEIRKMLGAKGLDRVFETGRMGPQRMAAAYEKLVPWRRRPGSQEPRACQPQTREVCLGAR